MHGITYTSLASRPSPFRTRFYYVYAANIRSSGNVCCMRIIKMCTERGRPGTKANIYYIYVYTVHDRVNKGKRKTMINKYPGINTSKQKQNKEKL